MDKDLKYLSRIVAGAHNVKDFTDLLKKLIEQAADVRIKLPKVEHDSIEIREAIASYLQESVDSIRRLSDNRKQIPDDISSEDSI